MENVSVKKIIFRQVLFVLNNVETNSTETNKKLAKSAIIIKVIFVYPDAQQTQNKTKTPSVILIH